MVISVSPLSAVEALTVLPLTSIISFSIKDCENRIGLSFLSKIRTINSLIDVIVAGFEIGDILTVAGAGFGVVQSKKNPPTFMVEGIFLVAGAGFEPAT